MDDNNFQNSLCNASMKQKLSGPIEAHGPFIGDVQNLLRFSNVGCLKVATHRRRPTVFRNHQTYFFCIDTNGQVKTRHRMALPLC